MVTLKSLQHVSQRHGDEVSVSYESYESFTDFFVQKALQQVDIFHAISLICEINKLNGGKHFPEYEIIKIKKHFSDRNRDMRSEKMESENDKAEIKICPKESRLKIEIMKYGISKGKSSKVDAVQRNLQKGYMSLLSNQI